MKRHRERVCVRKGERGIDGKGERENEKEREREKERENEQSNS